MSLSWHFQFTDILFGLLILAILVFVLYYLRRRFQRPQLQDLTLIEIKQRWQEIEKIMKVKKELNYKLAVIEADKLLDAVLKALGIAGQTVGERLKNAIYKYPKIKKSLWAHRVANQIVRQKKYHLRHGVARLVLKLFKKALKELKVL